MTTADPQEQRLEHPARPPAHVAADLTGGGNQAWIVRSGQVYGLRIIRAGKLILTK